MAFEAVAFKSARVDVGSTASAEHYLRVHAGHAILFALNIVFSRPPAHTMTSRERRADVGSPAVLEDQLRVRIRKPIQATLTITAKSKAATGKMR